VKVLLLLALTLFSAVSTIATVVMVSNVLTPSFFSTIKAIANIIESGNVQPTGGDGVDNPVAPC
jgi:hypothetical protein